MKYVMYFLLLFSSASYSSEVIRLEGISIQGNSEEPNMMYVTPWQEAPGSGRLFTPVKSYREQWLKPISRDIMSREVKYLNHFKQKEVYTPAGYDEQ